VIRLGRSFWWFLFLLAVSFTLTRMPEIGDNPIYSRLSTVLLIVLMVTGIWSVVSIQGLGLRRTSRVSRKQVGDVFTENFEVINRSKIPKIWLKITDQSDLSGGSGSRVLTWIGSEKARTYSANFLLDKRGWYLLGPSQIESGDLFGVFTFRKKIESLNRLLVIPHLVDIQAFPAPFGILPGGRAMRQKTLEVTPYAAGVREFVPGDPLKRIHWPTSARKQKLIVKEFEKDPLEEIWIFLDARKSTHFSQVESDQSRTDEFWWLKQRREFELPPDSVEYAISIAASISKYYIQKKREVGLISAGQSYSILQSERGERQLGKIMETLAVLKAEGDLPLWGLITSHMAHMVRGSTIVVITPSADEKIITVVMEMLHRRLTPVVILIDQVSFGGNEDVSKLELTLVDRGILTFVVREGDNLKEVLESPRKAFK